MPPPERKNTLKARAREFIAKISDLDLPEKLAKNQKSFWPKTPKGRIDALRGQTSKG
jgi:hypothetical protein